MSDNNTPANTVTYGSHTFDFATLPESTRMAMLRRGVSHYLGSEQASKLLGKIEKGIVEGTDEADTKARTEKFEALEPGDRRAAIKAFRDANADLITKWEAEIQTAAITAMVEGKVGTSVRGPSVDPLTTVVNRLAKAEVANVLKANKTAVPKKAEDKITFPNGDAFTMAELVERRKAHETHGPRLVKEAKAVIAAQERAAKKAEAEGVSDL